MRTPDVTVEEREGGRGRREGVGRAGRNKERDQTAYRMQIRPPQPPALSLPGGGVVAVTRSFCRHESKAVHERDREGGREGGRVVTPVHYLSMLSTSLIFFIDDEWEVRAADAMFLKEDACVCAPAAGLTLLNRPLNFFFAFWAATCEGPELERERGTGGEGEGEREAVTSSAFCAAT